jgi:maleylpyruvate isomerase
VTTTTPSREQALAWVSQGTALFLQAIDGLDDLELDRSTQLPGWTRRHVIAHTAANATALVRLATWARTGVVTPMYASAHDRAQEIEKGSRRSAVQLRAWLRSSATDLTTAFDRLTTASTWHAEVVTAGGRTVPAAALPWLRAKEVSIHAVDLTSSADFEDLPAGLCTSLVADAVEARTDRADGPALRLTATDDNASWHVAGSGGPVAVHLPTARLAAYLTGRHAPADLPSLPPWL